MYEPSRIAVALMALGLAACRTRDLGGPGAAPPDMACATTIHIAQNVKTRLDVLFLVDNSNAMDAMQAELRESFDQFFRVFQDLADDPEDPTFADLHIGVVTSDFGAGATGAPGCALSGGGDQGRLVDLGRAAPPGCRPPLGDRFIRYHFADSGAGNNLPPGQGLAETFSCMASVGSSGCGFEHQLESVYAALHNNIPENAGFLREDAILVVVFLTNEDDCSGPPGADVYDKNQVAKYGYVGSYRCLRHGVVCDGQAPPYGSSGGPLAGCRPAPNPDGAGPGRLHDVSRYIDFFNKPAGQGGVKRNPNDVVLIGISPPADPVDVILSNPGTGGGQPYPRCPALNEASNPPCVPVVQHSCQDPRQPAFFGDPAVRLNTVIAAARNHRLHSICDADYRGVLQDGGKLIVSQVGAGCLARPLPDPTRPACDVVDLTTNIDGTTTVKPIPSCSQSNAPPCWRAQVKPQCSALSPQSLGITVERGGLAAPPDTETRVTCTATSC